MSLGIGDAGYRIIGPIASGGMGEVYKAEHVITGRIEAIKLLSGAATGQEADRFLREVRLQASLSHPNIAAVYNAFRVNGNLVLVMELVEGEPLRALLARGRLPLALAIDYACQVLQAIGYANAHGVIHRDISPSNIVVTPQGTIKLMDFGLAKTPAASASLSGTCMGSPHYMAPEQVKDASRASVRSDIYSFGAVLYEMVTGRKVFPGDSSFEVMQAQVDTAPVPPIEVDFTVPPALNNAILTALEKDPERRFPSADPFREVLEQVIREEPAGAPAAFPPVQAQRRSRVPIMQFVVTGAVILAVAYHTATRRPPQQSTFTPRVIEIRMPSPPPLEVPAAPERPEPPPAPRPRRPARVARAPKIDATRIVPGEEPRLAARQVQAPAERVPELAAPPPISLAAAPSPELEPPVIEPLPEKKPNRVRRALGKILSPFQRRPAETPPSKLRRSPEADH